MLTLSHKKLDVWKMSVEFVKDIYTVTSEFPKSEMFGITNQLRRASVSIASNIAEGAARESARDRRRFYQIARSSLVEIDTQVEISNQLGYCSVENVEMISEKINHIFAKLTNLIKKTN